MANANETSPAKNRVRVPTPGELAELATWLQSTGHDPDVAKGTAECASIAVFDDYCTDCPGYSGKLMSVVWSGSPTFFDVFTWEDGKLERSGRDYDQHECSRCGASNGTLCCNCWRSHERKATARSDTPTGAKHCCHCSRPVAPHEARCRYCILEVEASEAFWAVIVRHFPTAKYGDLSPERTIRQITANVDAIEEWISNNVPDEQDKQC